VARAGQNIGRRGADITPGDTSSIEGSAESEPLGAVAAIGGATVEVYAQPRVAILSTGNEVDRSRHRARPGQILRRQPLHARARRGAHGCVPDLRPPVIDTVDALTAALDACAGADVMIFSGGSSVGERDLIVDLVASAARWCFTASR
jgi:molybdopterin biosynthesis enzyme